MSISHLRLSNFRLIAQAELSLAPGANLLVGMNAQGKTTVLEAISYIARGRSFRTARDREVLPGADAIAAVEAAFTRRGNGHDVRAAITATGKTFWLDGKQLRTLGELWGALPVVTFLPDDLQLVGGPPALRRALLDALLTATDPSALRVLQSYDAALRQRNALLRHQAPNGEFAAWEDQMARWGEAVIARRAALASDLAAAAAGHVAALTDSTEQLQITHEPGLPAPLVRDHPQGVAAERLRALWEETRPADLERGHTRWGPHRGDLALALDGRDCRLYASQGQTRTVALALRLAECSVLEAGNGSPPVLLLDDVLGELDRHRSEHFIRLLSRRGVQSILTATDATPLEAELPIAARFAVARGVIGKV